MAKAPLGVLLLHGLSSHINCIDPVVPRLVKHGIPYRMPFLRGHGTKPEDLYGVRYTDWLTDGHKAFYELTAECEKVVIVALSMGALVGINVTLAHQEKVAGLVCIAPALRYKSKAGELAPLIALFQKELKLNVADEYFDKEQIKSNANYPWIPSSAAVELLNFQKYTRKPERLQQLKTPLLVLETRHDKTIDPQVAQFLLDSAGSRDKKLIWFDKCGHEMLRDAEREQVLDRIEEFVLRIQKQLPSQPEAAKAGV